MDWLGRAIRWPFTYGYDTIMGERKEKERIDQKTTSILQRPRSLRQRVAHDSTAEWVLSPTLSQANVLPGYKTTASSASGTLFTSSHEDLSMSAFFGSHDESYAPAQNHSLLAVPIPIEEESFPAYLAGLPDTAFPRYKLVLPKRTKLLVLDLDETLVHSTSSSAVECDFLVEVLVEHLSCLYYVHKRPFVEHFLDVVSNWYQLAIYTASLREYADPVVNMLDRGRRLFQKRLFRSACIEKDGSYLKDLSLIDPDLSRVFLLDNSTISFILNPENGMFIDSWLDDKKDTGLLDLLPFLDALRFVEDVRSILSLRTFN